MLGTDASKANILEAIREAVAKTKWGDRIVVHNSTHGTYIPNVGVNDEPDGRDEAFCPDDFQSAGLIVDDQVAVELAKRAFGSSATWFADSCHAGTLSKLFEHDDVVKFGKFIPPHKAMDLTRAQMKIVTRDDFPVVPKRTAVGGIILHAACREDQVAYDAWFPDTRRYSGAFTRALLQALPENKTTHGALHKSTVALVGDFDQAPQLVTHRPYQRYYLF